MRAGRGDAGRRRDPLQRLDHTVNRQQLGLEDCAVLHHATRPGQARAVVARLGAATAGDTAQRLHWTRRLRAFGELDPFNQALAVTETAAHLDLLAQQSRLQRSEVAGVRRYRLASVETAETAVS